MKSRVLISILVSLLAIGTLTPAMGDAKGVPNENAVGYWTQERRDNAIARDFQFEPGAKVGKLVPQAKPGSSSGGTTTSSTTFYWPNDQTGVFVVRITGKVFFRMNNRDYVCSGSLIKDDSENFAVVITAGHCVWDNSTKGGFATNWSFFPSYDTQYKANSKGFSANRLYVRKDFSLQTSFNSTAILNDFAFAVIDSNDSLLNPGNLPGLVDSQNFFSKNDRAFAFGYPQASPYNGKELIYSSGLLSTDPGMADKTWKLASNLTGGASGGPWYQNYMSGDSVGTVGSVNSYKYTTDPGSMYGPKFSQSTLDLLTATKNANCAITTTINCTVLP
jgi:hypothetical protein